MIDVDYDQICKMLTLRYNPNKPSSMTPLKFEDFEPREFSNLEEKILHIIEKNLLQKQEQSKFDTVSLSLSGGIDSGLTLVMLRRFLPNVKINCISFGFGHESDEVERAKELARIYNCDFHEIIKVDVLSDLPKLIHIVKEPRWNLYHFYPFEEGKKFSKVFFTGDGADELFGGYTFRYIKYLSNFEENFGWKDRVRLYLSCHERDWVPDQEEMFGEKIDFSWDKIYEIFRDYFDNGLSPLNQVFLADFNGKLLYDWLHSNSCFKQQLNLEIESMFLSQEMISFAIHIPWEEKYNQETNRGKILLSSILEKNNGFANKIPPLKQGFATDLQYFWEKNLDVVNTYVNSSSEIVKNGIISKNWIEKIQNSDKLNSDPRCISKMLGLLALEIWYRLFISQSMNKDERL